MASRSLRETDLKIGKETMSSGQVRGRFKGIRWVLGLGGIESLKHNVAYHMDAGGTTTGISRDFTSFFLPKYHMDYK